MAGDDWRNSKYIYAISSLQASLYQLNEFISNSLKSITSITASAAFLTPHVSEITVGDTVDASYQKNLIQLLDVGDENKELNFRFIKQRTNKWRMIRE